MRLVNNNSPRLPTRSSVCQRSIAPQYRRRTLKAPTRDDCNAALPSFPEVDPLQRFQRFVIASVGARCDPDVQYSAWITIPSLTGVRRWISQRYSPDCTPSFILPLPRIHVGQEHSDDMLIPTARWRRWRYWTITVARRGPLHGGRQLLHDSRWVLQFDHCDYSATATAAAAAAVLCIGHRPVGGGSDCAKRAAPWARAAWWAAGHREVAARLSATAHVAHRVHSCGGFVAQRCGVAMKQSTSPDD